MILRNDYFLMIRLRTLWQEYFPDLAYKNSLTIGFGRASKTRLGSLVYSRERNHSNMTITRYFMLDIVPEYVIDATILHELTHYAHGFSSSHERRFRHPHKGGVIRKELSKRGAYEVYKMSRKWLRLHWRDVVRTYAIKKKKRPLVRSR